MLLLTKIHLFVCVRHIWVRTKNGRHRDREARSRHMPKWDQFGRNQYSFEVNVPNVRVQHDRKPPDPPVRLEYDVSSNKCAIAEDARIRSVEKLNAYFREPLNEGKIPEKYLRDRLYSGDTHSNEKPTHGEMCL